MFEHKCKEELKQQQRADEEPGLLAVTGQLLGPFGAQTLQTTGGSQQQTHPSAAGQKSVYPGTRYRSSGEKNKEDFFCQAKDLPCLTITMKPLKIQPTASQRHRKLIGAGIIKRIRSLTKTPTILHHIVTRESTEEEDKIILQTYQWLL